MAKITLTAEIVVEQVETPEEAIDAIVGMLVDYEIMNPYSPNITVLIKP